MPAICIVTTSPMLVRCFLLNHIAALCERAHVTLVVNGTRADIGSVDPRVRVIAMRVERNVSVRHDMTALWRLILFFANHKFDIVHSVAPKAGLLAMAASWLVGVPIRIHHFQGEVWANKRGIVRHGLKSIDMLIAGLATNALVVSASEREFLISSGVLPHWKSNVLGPGSISGVDIARFTPAPRRASRLRHNIGDEEFVIMFVGRVNYDKGVIDLADAFRLLHDKYPQLVLWLVGPDESDLIEELLRRAGGSKVRAIASGAVDDPEMILPAADVVCLPSYREGFGSVLLEAAACRVPAVASRIYGICDAVIDGETGLLHRAGDVLDLAARLEAVIVDPELRARLGEQARMRVLSEFRSDAITELLVRYYDRQFSAAAAKIV